MAECQKGLDRLALAILKDCVDQETGKRITPKERERRERLKKELATFEHKREMLPDLETTKLEARRIRQGLQDYYGSEAHFNSMSFEEKRKLLHFLFDGTHPETEEKFGIYIQSRRKNEKNFDYFIIFKGVFELATMDVEKFKKNQQVVNGGVGKFLDRNRYHKSK